MKSKSAVEDRADVIFVRRRNIFAVLVFPTRPLLRWLLRRTTTGQPANDEAIIMCEKTRSPFDCLQIDEIVKKNRSTYERAERKWAISPREVMIAS